MSKKDRKILFVTGNKRKAWQAQTALTPFDITVEPKNLDVDEIQSQDASAIGRAKAKAAYEIIQKPLVVNDHFWSIPALNGFPGGYIKDINQWFTAQDYLQLLKPKQDKSCILSERVVFFDGKNFKEFHVDFRGTFIDEERGVGSVSAERIVVFDGTDKTIAEHIDAGEHARDVHRSAWNKFGTWYKENG